MKLFTFILLVFMSGSAFAEQIDLMPDSMDSFCISSALRVDVGDVNIFGKELGSERDCHILATRYEMYIKAAQLMNRKIRLDYDSSKLSIALERGELLFMPPSGLAATCWDANGKYFVVASNELGVLYDHLFDSAAECQLNVDDINRKLNAAKIGRMYMVLRYTDNVGDDWKISGESMDNL